MAKIEVKLDVTATEATIAEVEMAAQAQIPPEFAQNATVTRDPQGKAISVAVNLPSEVAAVDLDNATQAIKNSPGVGQATPFPLVHDSNFDSQPALNATTGCITSGDIEMCASPFSGAGLLSKWSDTVFPHAEGESGTEGIKLVPLTSAFASGSGPYHYSVNGSLLVSANQPLASLSEIRAFEIEFDIRRNSLNNGAATNAGDTSTSNAWSLRPSLAFGPTQNGFALSHDSAVGPNWTAKLLKSTPPGGPAADTGVVPLDNWLHVKCTWDQSGTMTMVAGAANISVTNFTLAASAVHQEFSLRDLHSATTLNGRQIMVVDNYKMTILDGA